MPFLDKIITDLNSNWVNSFSSVVSNRKIKTYGISELILEPVEIDENTTKTKKYPGVIDADAEVKACEIDDAYHLVWWHRLESITNTVLTKPAFGDKAGDVQETVNMSMIVAGFRNKIRRSPAWVEAVLKDKMQDTGIIKDSTGKIIQRMKFITGNSNFDKLALLNREFSEIELNYADVLLFELKFQIISTWQKGCLDICGC